MGSEMCIRDSSNTYLAMRVAFFNELDTFCLQRSLDANAIIKAVCFDSRINDVYNNPSFGYGGYCLPKDTKQLLSSYDNVPQDLISSIIKSNETRKDFICKKIMQKNPEIVGIYKLAMKKGSDNFRESSIVDIIKKLKRNKVQVIIYEPEYKGHLFMNCKLVDDFENFVKKSNMLIANRADKKIMAHKNKLFSRDLFNEN